MAHLFEFSNQIFQLLPQKAIYWSNEKTLIIADLHLGKASHFRKAGLAIPAKSSEADYKNLTSLLLDIQPVRLLILGDLFHSSYNNEWLQFANLIKAFPKISFELIIGNHDILATEKYNSIGLKLLGEILVEENLFFSHHPLNNLTENQINFCGHIHPGIQLIGLGKQKITMPCFFRNKTNFILPAFGALTGLQLMKKDKTTEIFGISGNKIFQL